MDKIQFGFIGIIIGIGIGAIITVITLPEKRTIYRLINECEKDLPRSSTCELYAKEKK